MKPFSLSSLVVSCKDYKPSHDWYLCISAGGIYGVANTPDWPDYDEVRHNEYDTSDDYILMPECPGMTDEEATEVVKLWCVQNSIPYIDDMDRIEEEYHYYYKY